MFTIRVEIMLKINTSQVAFSTWRREVGDPGYPRHGLLAYSAQAACRETKDMTISCHGFEILFIEQYIGYPDDTWSENLPLVLS